MLFGRHDSTMPEPGRVLPGRRDRPFPVPENHAVLGHPLEGPFPAGIDTAYFALGCFWGAERLFWRMDGIWTTAVGYQNGSTPNPTYEEVCSGRTGHAESVLVGFDPEVTPYATLLEVFFTEHDPTQGMRQGNDVGTQYRSGIFTVDGSQAEAARRARDGYAEALAERGLGPITTAIEPAGPFYYAEEQHQQYLHKVPNGYCGLAGTGVACRLPAD
ncbi:MAG: peptide-methionine (S)-S-oxide reductase MsrA [Solirubrobacterales bacterium]|nr:peptide-methionine (S)-S-oxide reductase MsrA [Solirubrobacterales bacterium]